MDFSSSSSSSSDGDDSVTSDADRRLRKSSKKSKGSKKKKSSRSKSKSSKEKKHKKSSRRHHDSDDKKRRKEKKDRKRKDRGSSDEDSSSQSSRREHKRSRKERERKSKKRSKKEKERDSRGRSTNGDDNNHSSPPVDARSTNLARALNRLLGEHPPMASELPLILIRLAGGTTMDLRHMTDASAAHGLQNVLSCLQPFGVNEEDHVWSFSTPAMQQQLGSRQRRDELVLLRVVRSLLDDVGINMDTVSKYEASTTVDETVDSSKATSVNQGIDDTELHPPSQDVDHHENLRKAMKERTIQFLMAFHDQDATLGQQLAGLCATIVNGESVSIDGIPDEKLKHGLSSLFEACGLERSEMDNDDEEEKDEDDDDDDDDGPTYGYGLPDDTSSNDVNLRIAAVMEACREKPKSRRIMGPMRGTPEDIEQAKALPIHEPEVEDEEDEGPMLPGAVQRGPTLPPELIKAQAERRQLELKATAAGVEIPKTDASGREEWILLPGKYDFLSGIKTGQAATKSRGFQNKKVESKDEAPAPIHPAVQRELDKIMQAHEEARGPSLMDQHRNKRTKEKEEERAAAAANGGRGKKNFNWSRDKDLDEGRRVDKDALRMVLGGAADGLKTKFQGGLNH